MFAICIESSHKRGLGHLFRAINFIQYLEKMKEKYIVFLNQDKKSMEILELEHIQYELVNLSDYESNWEYKLIEKYGIDIWVNDRLDTDIRTAENVKKGKIKLYTIDDGGTGAALAEANFASLVFDQDIKLEGKQVFRGTDYLILNREIDKYKRIRKSRDKIVISMGGSDTYGVTRKVMEILKSADVLATIILGPGSKIDELSCVADGNFEIKRNISSLVKEFFSYDLAITGGGITCIEANAAGLPCIIIANELHEIQIGKYMEHLGSSVFAGYYQNIDYKVFNRKLDLQKMSLAGLNKVKTDGADRIYNIIKGGGNDGR